MFPRKKKNPTGTISVVVIDKSRGKYKEVKNFGVAKTEEEADVLYSKAAECDGSGLIVPPKTVSNVPPVAE